MAASRFLPLSYPITVSLWPEPVLTVKRCGNAFPISSKAAAFAAWEAVLLLIVPAFFPLPSAGRHPLQKEAPACDRSVHNIGFPGADKPSDLPINTSHVSRGFPVQSSCGLPIHPKSSQKKSSA